jgi:4-amino-4-deoxy-L-arabinose transferase-like glycosyltransferase
MKTKKRILTGECLILVLILFIAAVFRLWQLGKVPPGIANDEAGYIYSAYSIWKTGRDPTGKFLPLSINLDNSFSPVYIYATAPFVGLLGLSPGIGRLPFALVGIISVFLVYLVTKKLSQNSKVALGAAGMLALTPWHIYVSRAAFDANFALVFFLAGINSFLDSENKKIKYTIWSLIWFFLAFYSYHATKIYFLLLAPTLLFLYWKSRTTWQRVMFIVGIILILISYVFIVKSTGPNSRSEVLLWQNPSLFENAVIWERDKSTLPLPYKLVFSNKATVALRKATETYLEAFSTNYLFLYGETGALTSVYGGIVNQGQLFIFMLPFLILGVVGVSHAKTRTKILMTMLIMIAPVPAAVASDRTLIFRSYMLLIPLSILGGFGIYEYLEWICKQRSNLRWVMIGGYSLFITLTLIFYIVHMWFRYPVYGAERWFRSSTDLSLFVKNHYQGYTRVVIVQPGPMFLFQYAMVDQTDPVLVQHAWRDRPQGMIKNIVFSDMLSCPKLINPEHQEVQSNMLIVLSEVCTKTLPPTIIPIETIRDRGNPDRVIWSIYRVPD